MTHKTLFIVISALICLSAAVNEPKTDSIAVEPLSPACIQRQTNNAAGGFCTNKAGQRTDGPSPFPCPCLEDDKAGGAFPGNGKKEIPNPQFTDFVDYTIGKNPPVGFNSLTGYAFTDNTNEIYVLAKAGVVYRIDTKTELITTFYDFSKEVHDVGDHGGLSIEVNTNFAKNPYVYVSHVMASIYGSNTDFDTVSYVRVLRLTSRNGQLADKATIIGQDKLDSNVICSSSHAGGALAMGHDGSLFITLGEGSHFDADVLDFGQPQDRYPSSKVCGTIFPGQDLGSMRAQSKDTLGGKLIRVDPASGNGICQASQGYNTLNPFCPGGANPNLRSPRARIWAMGFRNPFSMNMRPKDDSDTPNGPGVPYVGDVGFGSYEEINAITKPGLNLGWPCWEGPQPMGGFRDSPLNNLALNVTRPKADDGSPINCPYVYRNVQTTTPTFYWSRYTHDMGGVFGESFVLGQGFTGNCVSGVAFYTGTSYPAQYKNQVFFSDYGTQWIKSMTTSGDKKVDQSAFLSLSIPVVDLEINPATGDVCYMELLQGRIHCIAYQGGARPATIVIKSNVTAGDLPLGVAFSTDNSWDRANTTIAYTAWDFGDGSGLVVDPNPTHTYTTAGKFVATAFINNGAFTVNKSLTILAGTPRPTAVITSPSAGSYSSFGGFFIYNGATPDQVVTFNGLAQGGTPPYNYFWDVYMVHTNHYHPESYTATTAQFQGTLNQLGAASHIGERINFLAVFKVTDAKGQTDSTYVRMVQAGYWSSIPVALFTYDKTALSAGQFILFDASQSYDTDLDYLTYMWDFGDNNTIGFDTATTNRYIYHAYSRPGTYTVTLTLMDNYQARSQTTSQITIAPGYSQNVIADRAANGAITTTSCSGVFARLVCRTSSQNPNQLNQTQLSDARSWLCGAYPDTCKDIGAGAKYSFCNPAEQMSVAMNQYYKLLAPTEGSKACDFGGLGNFNAAATATDYAPTTAPIDNGYHGSTTKGDTPKDTTNRPQNNAGSLASYSAAVLIAVVVMCMAL